MATYEITVTVSAGADPTGNSLDAKAIFEDGQEDIANDIAYLDGLGGYNPVVVQTAGRSGSEKVWIQLFQLDTNFNAIQLHLIGPYLLSDIGVVT